MSLLTLLRYQTETGKTPFTHWLVGLKDVRARAQIEIRLRRASIGNFGDCEPVGEGVIELRIDIGAGYRVYCARHGKEVVILLCGGDKSTQHADIRLAKEYWTDWKRRNK